MKKLLLALYILIPVSVFSQDTVILKTGEIIPCRFENISKTGVITYYYFDSAGNPIMAEKGVTFIKEVKTTDSHLVFTQHKYKSWISLNTPPFEIKGALHEIKDSSISVARPLPVTGYIAESYWIEDLHIRNIETIRARRDYNIGLGASLGAVTGAATMVILGLISDNSTGDLSSMEGAGIIGAGIMGMVGGGIVGAVIGSVKIKVPINGNMESFTKAKSKLKKYTR